MPPDEFPEERPALPAAGPHLSAHGWVEACRWDAGQPGRAVAKPTTHPQRTPTSSSSRFPPCTTNANGSLRFLPARAETRRRST